jgi:hypothetical protein
MKALFGYDWRNWLRYLSRYDAVYHANDEIMRLSQDSEIIGYPTGFV